MLVLEGRVFFRGVLEPLSIGVESGRIVRIAKTLVGDERRDYGDRLILPGGVDLHVHFREPGMTEAEDFSTGTMAAAIGGVTAVFDMPNTKPPVTSRAAFEDKVRAVRRKANVDFGLYGALRSARDAKRWASLGAPGKMYTAHSAGDLEVTDDATQRAIVESLAVTGLRATVHAEDASMIAAQAGTSLEEHNAARPPEAESSAIRKLSDAAKTLERPVRIHIAHVTSRAALDALSGTSFTTEATPHHLLLDANRRLKTLGKVNPPLRPPEDREALWRALVEGRIDAVASDHAPRTETEKDVPFEEAPPGLPGVETALPLLLRKAKAGDLDIARFVDVAARRPAEILGLDLGVLEPGRPASLIVVDPRDVRPIRARDLHSKCGWTPFEGMEAVFPVATYVRGELVAEERALAAERLGVHLGVGSDA
ncbi:MAG TPA: dihydroorotase [Thermoplasmata archaeon]|nr:dihydroorotase [Thermoplasmata archaeon]